MQNHRIVFPLVFLFLLSTVSLSIASNEKYAKLIEGAKKEGKMVFYVSTNIDHAMSFANAFQHKYPFVKVEILRLGSDRMTARVLAEASAGKLGADVIQTTSVEVFLYEKKGILMKFMPMEGAKFPAAAKDPDGNWVSVYEQWFIVGYNTKLVPPKDVPKTYEDLLDPKWKGKISMDGKEYRWFGTLEQIWGRKKWIDFMNRYGQQDIILRNGKTLIGQLMAAGEFALGCPLYPSDTEGLKVMGAPADTVFVDPIITNLHPFIVNSTAPHKNAAQLFVEFMLSEDGQATIASIGRIPSFPIDITKIYPSFKGKTIPNKYPITPRLAEQLSERAEELRAEFRTVFVKKEKLR